MKRNVSEMIVRFITGMAVCMCIGCVGYWFTNTDLFIGVLLLLIGAVGCFTILVLSFVFLISHSRTIESWRKGRPGPKLLIFGLILTGLSSSVGLKPLFICGITLAATSLFGFPTSDISRD